MSSNFLSDHNISKIYRYFEKASGTDIEYGWVESDDFDFVEDSVIAYHSRTKKASEEELLWSKNEGNSVSTLSDHIMFFTRSVGLHPSDFVDLYESNNNLLRERFVYPLGIEDDDFDNVFEFMYKLSKFYLNGKKFIHSGRGYKMVKV